MKQHGICLSIVALILSTGLVVPAAFASFTSVNVNGNIAVQLRQAPARQADSLHISNQGGQWVQARIKNQVLYLTTTGHPSAAGKPAKVSVQLHRLYTLSLAGQASATGKRLPTTPLVINDNASGAIRLMGKVNLTELNQHSSSQVMVRWINSKQLNIHSDQAGHIQLAGVVDTLRARLSGKSQLDAQYLRAQDALIKTQDFAKAKVLSTHSLRAFASNQSNIYYYKTPKSITRVSKNSANILQLDWRD